MDSVNNEKKGNYYVIYTFHIPRFPLLGESDIKQRGINDASLLEQYESIDFLQKHKSRLTLEEIGIRTKRTEKTSVIVLVTKFKGLNVSTLEAITRTEYRETYKQTKHTICMFCEQTKQTQWCITINTNNNDCKY